MRWGLHSGASGSVNTSRAEPHVNYTAASRGFVTHAWGEDKVTPKDRVTASAIAGGVGGTAGGILRRFISLITTRRLPSDKLHPRTDHADLICLFCLNLPTDRDRRAKEYPSRRRNVRSLRCSGSSTLQFRRGSEYRASQCPQEGPSGFLDELEMESDESPV